VTPRAHGLRLGGLRFAVVPPSGDVSTEDEDDVYAPFSESIPPAAADVQVHLSFDEAPDVRRMSPLFEGGLLYTVYADGADRVVVIQPPGAARPSWIARFTLEVRDVTLWYDTVSSAPGEHLRGGVDPLRYPLDQILLMYALASREGLLVHAAGAVVGGRTLLCCGRSGAGKSTLTRQFLATGVTDILSDDRIIVRRVGTELLAYGTPWPGEARIASAGSAPLCALLFLSKGRENTIRELSSTEALHRLFPVGSIPWYDRGALPGALAFCEWLIGAVPAFELEFLPEPAAAETVRDFFAQAVVA